MIELRVNGTAKKFDGDVDMPLLWFLRDVLELTGTKFGCGLGLCGACTVHVNGAAVRSCQTTMKAAAGKSITTIEGLAHNPVQAAWEHGNVPQCGYCQSGQIMQAVALLKDKPKPTDKRYRRNHAGQHLPLRDVSTHTRGDQDRRGGEGMNRIELVVSRRGFLGIFSAGAFVLATDLKADATTWQPNVYLGMEPSGMVTIVAHRSEMGTGIKTVSADGGGR